MRRARLVLMPLLLLATMTSGCTDGDDGATPKVTATEINPCDGATPAPGCITSTPGASTAYPYPDEAGKISPLAVPPRFEGEILRKDNNLAPGVRTATFTVTIPKGKVIATALICQGRGEVVVKTTPVSDGEITITCDGNPLPSQLEVFASKPETADRTYSYTLRASGPSRWLVAVSARPPG